MNRFSISLGLTAIVLLSGCQVVDRFVEKPAPLPMPTGMDLEAYMGRWFVIAATPTMFDRNTYNAAEYYSLTEDGIDITYQYNKGSFGGELKTHSFKGKIDNPGINTDWQIRLGWPIQADYKIIYLDDEYSITIVGHPNRKYVWLMARTPSIPDTTYSDLMLMLQNLGYDIGAIRKIPQIGAS